MENKEITLTLTIDKINILLSGLGELPSKISYELINEIHKQTNACLEPKETEQ